MACAETMLEAIKSPEATRVLTILEVACWRIWECPWSEVENLSSEEESEHSWDHVGYSYRLQFSLAHGPPHCYYMNHYLCSTYRTTNGRRIGRNAGESPVRSSSFSPPRLCPVQRGASGKSRVSFHKIGSAGSAAGVLYALTRMLIRKLISDEPEVGNQQGSMKLTVTMV